MGDLEEKKNVYASTVTFVTGLSKTRESGFCTKIVEIP